MSPYQPARTPALFICMMEIWSFTTMHSNHSLQPSHNNIASRSPQFFFPSFFSDDMECNLRVGVVSGRASCILSGYLVPLCMGSSAALKLSDKHPEHARTASCTGEADYPLVRSKIKVMCRMRCAWHLQDQQGKPFDCSEHRGVFEVQGRSTHAVYGARARSLCFVVYLIVYLMIHKSLKFSVPGLGVS